MATGIIDIDQVPPDIDPLATGIMKNPLKEDFTHQYAGRDITIPAEGSVQYPLTVCVHIAKHLAEKIIRAEFKRKISGIKDAKTKEIEAAKPIADYKGKIWDKMKELVETDSDFFDDEVKEVEGKKEESNKEKFTR